MEAARARRGSAAYDALLRLEAEASLSAAEEVLHLDPSQTEGWLVKLKCAWSVATTPWDEPSGALRSAWTDVMKLDAFRRAGLATGLMLELLRSKDAERPSIVVQIWCMQQWAAEKRRSPLLLAAIWLHAFNLQSKLVEVTGLELQIAQQRISALPDAERIAEWYKIRLWPRRLREATKQITIFYEIDPDRKALRKLLPLGWEGGVELYISEMRRKMIATDRACSELEQDIVCALVLGSKGGEDAMYSVNAVPACPYCQVRLQSRVPQDGECVACHSVYTKEESIEAGRSIAASPAFRILYANTIPTMRTYAAAQAADPALVETYSRWIWQLTETSVSRTSFRQLLVAPKLGDIERVMKLMVVGVIHAKQAKTAFCVNLCEYIKNATGKNYSVSSDATFGRVGGLLAVLRVLSGLGRDCADGLARLYPKVAALEMGAYNWVQGLRSLRISTYNRYIDCEVYERYLDALCLAETHEQVFELCAPYLDLGGGLEEAKAGIVVTRTMLERMTEDADVTTVMAAKEAWRAGKKKADHETDDASSSREAARWNELREKLRMYPGKPGSPILAALSGVGFLFYALGMIVGGDGAQSEDEKIGAYIAQSLFLALLGLSFLVSVKRIVVRRMRAPKWGAQAAVFIRDGKMAASPADGIALLEFMVRTVKPIGRFQAERSMEDVLHRTFHDDPKNLQQASGRFYEILGQASTKYSAPVVPATVHATAAHALTAEQQKRVCWMRSGLEGTISEDGTHYCANAIEIGYLGKNRAERVGASGNADLGNIPDAPAEAVRDTVIQKETVVRIEPSGHGSGSSSSAAQCARAQNPEPVLQKPVYKDVSTTVACKHCGAPTAVKVPHVKTPGSQVGGVTNASTGACRKCHKMSSYNYDIRDGQFTRLW